MAGSLVNGRTVNTRKVLALSRITGAADLPRPFEVSSVHPQDCGDTADIQHIVYRRTEDIYSLTSLSPPVTSCPSSMVLLDG